MSIIRPFGYSSPPLRSSVCRAMCAGRLCAAEEEQNLCTHRAKSISISNSEDCFFCCFVHCTLTRNTYTLKHIHTLMYTSLTPHTESQSFVAIIQFTGFKIHITHRSGRRRRWELAVTPYRGTWCYEAWSEPAALTDIGLTRRVWRSEEVASFLFCLPLRTKNKHSVRLFFFISFFL